MHEREGDAIREGPLFVVVAVKQLCSSVESFGVNPFQTQRCALESRFEKIGSRSVAVTHEQEGCGFIDDIIGREKSAVLAG